MGQIFGRGGRKKRRPLCFESSEEGLTHLNLKRDFWYGRRCRRLRLARGQKIDSFMTDVCLERIKDPWALAFGVRELPDAELSKYETCICEVLRTSRENSAVRYLRQETGHLCPDIFVVGNAEKEEMKRALSETEHDQVKVSLLLAWLVSKRLKSGAFIDYPLSLGLLLWNRLGLFAFAAHDGGYLSLVHRNDNESLALLLNYFFAAYSSEEIGTFLGMYCPGELWATPSRASIEVLVREDVGNSWLFLFNEVCDKTRRQDRELEVLAEKRISAWKDALKEMNFDCRFNLRKTIQPVPSPGDPLTKTRRKTDIADIDLALKLVRTQLEKNVDPISVLLIWLVGNRKIMIATLLMVESVFDLHFKDVFMQAFNVVSVSGGERVGYYGLVYFYIFPLGYSPEVRRYAEIFLSQDAKHPEIGDEHCCLVAEAKNIRLYLGFCTRDRLSESCFDSMQTLLRDVGWELSVDDTSDFRGMKAHRYLHLFAPTSV